ncbi:hypothetical protein JD844_018465 [Phrynosoma platyrhinos]|uniref:11-beta-hydroxysteroid dehydrogenase 1 n=1 Tax=Phrynosoma platyrhinos TaxID=52577 RepID=A0ABQ7SNP5_PHRPL|nr:hypothetical protein JD844_018465 [Phrynosoma platyrhinos]
MGLFPKILVPLIALVLAGCFYSRKEDFKPEMLRGKHVIVTGASMGIGEQMAYHLASMGSHILITARTEAKLQKVNVKYSYIHVLPQVVSRCLELGAASARYMNGSMEDIIFAQLVVKKAEELWGKHSKGIFLGKILRKVGFPFTVPYSATKFALDGFFSSLRQEFVMQNTNVSITLCILGLIDTESAMKATSGVFTSPAAPKEECALEIIKGGALRQREVYYEYKSTKIPLLIRDWAPDLLDYLIRRSYNMEKLKED